MALQRVTIGFTGTQVLGVRLEEADLDGLLQALATIDRETDYDVFCFNKVAADSFHIDQPNFHFHVLRPGVRWISLPFSLPLAISRSGVSVCHATFVPPLPI